MASQYFLGWVSRDFGAPMRKNVSGEKTRMEPESSFGTYGFYKMGPEMIVVNRVTSGPYKWPKINGLLGL